MVEWTSALIPITAEQALQIINEGEPLLNYRVLGKLDLCRLAVDNRYFPYSLLIENCWVEQLRASGGLSFEKSVTLRQVHFVKADFVFAYFLNGLHIDGCTFDNYLDFQAGGHNKPGHVVQLSGNLFRGFVNFFDCWYEAEVILEDNVFEQGTNLLGAPFNIPVTFDVPLQQARNRGDLNRNDEGQEQAGNSVP